MVIIVNEIEIKAEELYKQGKLPEALFLYKQLLEQIKKIQEHAENIKDINHILIQI